MEEQKYVRLPAFLERGFLDLKNAVIAQGVCCLCGTCAAFCDKINISEGGKKEPVLIEGYDTVCGMCYTFCPRVSLPHSEIARRIFGDKWRKVEGEILGVYRGSYAVRSKRGDIIKKGQDGGAVTSLLAYALNGRIIDCAVITTTDTEWRPLTKVARTYEELKEGAGSKYTLCPSVIGVREAIKEGCEKIGFVGLPCQVQGLRKVQTVEQPYDVGIEKVQSVIGLFCMENFTEPLLDFVEKICGGSLEHVSKFGIKGEDLLVSGKETFSIPLEEIKSYLYEGCLVCRDYTAEFADISVGSVGSEEGWSTVFARTEIGEEIVKGAKEKEYIEVMKIEEDKLESIRGLAKRKSGMQRNL